MASVELKLTDPPEAGPSRGGAIADKLRAGILDGNYGPGAHLNEVHLSREFGVSRTPIRGALQILVGEGLLQYTPNKGYSVRAFETSEIIDAFEMRALAEGLAARLAAERGLSATDEMNLSSALEALDRAEAFAATAVAEGETSVVDLRAAYSDANERFHTAIHRAAASRLVADVITLCSRIPLTLTRHIIDFKIDKIHDRVEEHHRISDAIFSRRPREAEHLMYEHDQDVRRTLVRVLAKSANFEHRPNR